MLEVEINRDHAALIAYMRYLQALTVLHMRGRVAKKDYKNQMFFLLDPEKGGSGAIQKVLNILKIHTVEELHDFLAHYDINPQDLSFAEDHMLGADAIKSSSVSQGRRVAKEAIKNTKILPLYGHLRSLLQIFNLSNYMTGENMLNSVSVSLDAAKEALGTSWDGYIKLEKIYNDISERMRTMGNMRAGIFPADLAEEYHTIIDAIIRNMEGGEF